ncbi:MAG TPA: hypothetical protein VEF04_17755 [Blastocatellia bacterium]|nr:hypothetical protein [Blastocatellia bacterium]
MKIRVTVLVLSLTCLLMASIQAQPNRKGPRQRGNRPIVKTNAKPKTQSSNAKTSNNRYANQEVSYLKSNGNEVAMGNPGRSKSRKRQQNSVIFEPNNEPLWAKSKNSNNRRNSARNEDIEVKNDETHRTKPQAVKQPGANQTNFILPYVEQSNRSKPPELTNTNRKGRRRKALSLSMP